MQFVFFFSKQPHACMTCACVCVCALWRCITFGDCCDNLIDFKWALCRLKNFVARKSVFRKKCKNLKEKFAKKIAVQLSKIAGERRVCAPNKKKKQKDIKNYKL